MKKYYSMLAIFFLSSVTVFGQFDDASWDTVYHESFSGNYNAVDGQQFGESNWLLFQLLNGGSITIANGYAQLNADDFQMAALVRSRQILPSEYKLRTKIGYINYDLGNYEGSDFVDPNFNTHGGNYENGMYFLTVTDDTCVANECAENWWHYHRKMVIDVDNHINSGGGETFHPVYMVYMAPQTNSGGNLLRTWTGSSWDTSPWNWNVAATYDSTKWYYAELEKYDGLLTLRLYDENENIIEETTPVNLSLVNAMNNPQEYLYVGEPHTDDYEGNVRIDEITLFVYDSLATDIDDVGDKLPVGFALSQNYPNPFNPTTTILYTLPQRTHVQIEIYNLLGQKVSLLVNKDHPAGSFTTTWDGNDANGNVVASGIYLYRITTDSFTSSKQMLLLK